MRVTNSMKSDSRPTISDVAAKAGVDPKTVTNVLAGRTKGKRRDAVARAQLIHRIADELGYRPNTAARATRMGRFSAFGLLQATTGGGGMTPRQTLWGIEELLLKKNLQLVLGHFPVDRLRRTAELPRLLREWSVDGLMLHYTEPLPEGLVDHIDQATLPCVWINRNEPTNCVHPDDYAAASRATRMLIEAGHQRISYIGTDSSALKHYSSTDRLKGYLDQIKAAGLTEDVREHPSGRGPYTVGLDLLNGPERPTGIVSASGGGELLMVCERLGFTMPKDLSLVMLRTEVGPVGPYEELSAMNLPLYRVGYAAVNMLEEMIAGSSQRLPSIAVPFIERPGETVGPPPRAP